MGYLERVKEIYKKGVRTNPIFSTRVVKKNRRRKPRKEELDLGKVKGKAEEEVLGEIGDYQLVTPIWEFERKKGDK